MITNMDDNFKKLDDKLEQLGLKENTIVIFMTDNGTADGFQVRDGVFYGNDGGMRGRKGSEYEGGHRVPFFIRWPDGKLDQNRDIPTLTAHIDVLPTLIDLCNLHFEQKNPLDGKSLKSLLYNQPWPWLDRILISDSQRLQNLIKWRKSATMSNDWRLINGQELYNIKEDPKQTTNVANKHPDVFKKLHDAYDSWWATLDSARVNQRYAYIIAGSPHENPVRISAHDLHVNRFDQMWHQVGALRGSRALGLFKVEFAESGTYQISLCRYPRESGYAINEHIPAVKTSVEVNRPMPESKPMNFSSAALYVGDFLETEKIEKGDKEVTFNVEMQKGKYDLKAMLMDDQGKRYPAYYLYIERKK